MIAENCLFDNVQDCIDGDGINFSGTHITISGGGWGPDSPYVTYTNSYLWGGVFEVYTNAQSDPACKRVKPVFVTCGNDHCYLSVTNPFRNYGIPDPYEVATNIQQLTTYAPQDGSYPDKNDQPDMGYHYPINEDFNNNGIPDWWEWEYFGNLNQASDWDYDGDGTINSDEFAGGTDPNKIQFSLSVTSYQVHTNIEPLQISIIGGVPSSIAVSLDDTNATWQPFDANCVANLGTNEGWHRIWVGLRGRLETSQQTWQNVHVRITPPDLTPPVLVITNPTVSTLAQPLVQIKGYASKPLARLRYDLTNAAGLKANLIGLVTGQAYDTNLLCFTTNYFQCYDLRFTNGANIVTLRATDLAGNTTTNTFTFTLDYSIKTNPPQVALSWPVDGTQVSEDNIIWRGLTDGSVVSIIGQSVNTNGVTNSAFGQIGRDGGFWIKNLPISGGTNHLMLTATDGVGRTSSTNITVIKRAVVLSITSSTWDSTSISGAISDPTAGIWVNGIQATNYGNGTWELQPSPISLDDSYIQVRAIPASDNGGQGTPNGGPQAHAANPNSSQAVDLDHMVEWPDGVIYQNEWHLKHSFPFALITIDENWTEAGGGTARETFLPTIDDLISWPAARWPLGSGVVVDMIHGTVDVGYQPLPPYSPSTGLLGHYESESIYYPNQQTVYCRYQSTMIAGGDAASSGLEFYRFSGEVAPRTNLDTCNSNLTSEQVQIGGLGNLETNGYLYAAVPTHSQAGVTASASSSPDFYKASSSANPDKFRIKLGGVDISGTNVTSVLVGQKVILDCGFDLPGPAITSYQWTVGGNCISNFYISPDPLQTNGYPVALTATKSSQVVFYWVDGGLNTVSCTVMAQGQPISADATFNVKKPSATLSATILGPVQVFGNELLFGAPPFPGISFWTLQPDTPGNWRYIQTGHQLFRYQNAADGKWARSEGSGLDGNYPSKLTQDQPGTGLPQGCTKVIADGSFTTYLAFSPSGGIYVPIRQIHWDWNGEAIFTSSNVWTLVSGAPHVDANDSAAPSTISWTDSVQRGLANIVFEP